MRIESPEHLARLVDSQIPESASLEYKSQLPLGTRGNKIEVLKDLSGLGNGGGGTVVYGVAEDPDLDGVPLSIVPLNDRRAIGVLEDVLRSGIRPPLLYELTALDLGEGCFVLICDVRRSPLGPYMVEAFGQGRYFIRHGTRTSPMTEQEVRDAYTLAARGRDQRTAVWTAHALPLTPPSDSPWLTVCGIPEEPLDEVFDPGKISAESLRPDESGMSLNNIHVSEARLSEAIAQLSMWSDGIYADDTYGGDRQPQSLFRLHRDGTAMIAMGLYEVINTWSVLRALNAQIAYLAWIWEHVGVRSAIEVDARLENLMSAQVEDPHGFASERRRSPKRPPAGPAPSVGLRRIALARELMRPSVRHAVIRDFGDRLYQAFNLIGPNLFFRWGQLYDQRGPVHVAIAGRGVLDQDGNELAQVDDRGGILNRGGHVVAFFSEGVVMDLDGRAIAALELAPGAALPDDFAPPSIHATPIFKTPGGNPGSAIPARHQLNLPDPLAEWSEESLSGLINSTEPRRPRGA